MKRKDLLPWLIAAAVVVVGLVSIPLDIPTADDALAASDNIGKVTAMLERQFKGQYDTVKCKPHRGWTELFVYGVADASLRAAMTRQIVTLGLTPGVWVNLIPQRFGGQDEGVPLKIWID